MKRSVLAIGFSSAIFTGMALSGASPAQALSCSSGSHCYGNFRWDVQAIYGMYEALTTSCLSVPNPGPNFATSEMWFGLPNNRWVEEGTAYGNPQGARLYNYWADQNVNGYFEHDQENATYSERYDIQISVDSAAGGSWYIYRDGSNVGRSTSNPGPGINVTAGAETTDSNPTIRGYAEDLLWENTKSVWNSGWQSPGFARPYQLGTMAAYWNSFPYTFEYGYNCGTFPVAPQSTPTAPTSSSSVTDMLARVKDLAKLNGEGNPSRIETVEAADTALNTFQIGGGVANKTGHAKRVIEMHGAFTGDHAKVPSGEPKPKGSYLVVAFDSVTGQITDWSIQYQHLDLDQLGRPATLE